MIYSRLLFPAAVPAQPTDFRGEAKSETSILLSWIAPGQTGQENQITGYELMYRKRDDKDEVTINGFKVCDDKQNTLNLNVTKCVVSGMLMFAMMRCLFYEINMY